MYLIGAVRPGRPARKGSPAGVDGIMIPPLERTCGETETWSCGEAGGVFPPPSTWITSGLTSGGELRSPALGVKLGLGKDASPEVDAPEMCRCLDGLLLLVRAAANAARPAAGRTEALRRLRAWKSKVMGRVILMATLRMMLPLPRLADLPPKLPSEEVICWLVENEVCEPLLDEPALLDMDDFVGLAFMIARGPLGLHIFRTEGER